MPTLSGFPPERTNAVVVIVVVVVVDVARGRNAKKNTTHNLLNHFLTLSDFLHARAICLTSVTIFDQ